MRFSFGFGSLPLRLCGFAGAVACCLLYPLPVVCAVDAQPTPAPGVPAAHGPTLQLRAGTNGVAGNPLSDFMYFVALISREPVSMVENPGNTQKARLLSITRRDTGSSFQVSCRFEIEGQGQNQNVFDHADAVKKEESKLRQGGVVDRLLRYIQVDGSGVMVIEVSGAMRGAAPLISEVRMRFNERSQTSPVTIELYDVRSASGALRSCNEMIARVSTLTFRRDSGPPTMEVAVASVRRKSAGDSAWENFVGGVKGTIANWVMPPVPVESVGHQAMLDFGLALVSGASSFTFPKARNLKANSVRS